MKPKALIVEDDRNMADIIKELLQSEGFHVAATSNADSALQWLGTSIPDLLILDVGLLGFSGIHLCKHLKGQRNTAGMPIMMVTSFGRERDKVQGLDSGADDYITKPFSPMEFRARVRALMRRVHQGGAPENTLKAKNITLNEDTRTVLIKGKEVELRSKEFDLLALFLKNKGKALSRQFIGETVWGPASIATSHTVEVSISNLREKLGSMSHCIVTIVGMGYKFVDR